MLNPLVDQFDSGYQLTQSLIAFGRGGWLGTGLGESIQKLFYLPEAHTDFLFAVLAEELGLVGVLVVITPVGLYLPEVFGAGSAWGEWSAEEVRQMVGYLPSGLGRLGRLWHAPLPDYALRGQESGPIETLGWSYVLSGVLGTAAVMVVVMGLRRVTAGRRRDAPGSGVDATSKRTD